MRRSPLSAARELMDHGDLDGAHRAAEDGLRAASCWDSAQDLWRLRFILARVLAMRSGPERALQYLRSLGSPSHDDPEVRIELSRLCGAYSGSLGRYDFSHRLLSAAADMAKEAGVLSLLAEALLSRAFVFFLQKDYASSDSLFREALGLSESLGGWYFRGHALWGIGKNLMIQEHHQEAMPWLDESLKIFDEAGARLEIAMVWSEMAVCHLGMGDDEKAMELLRGAERINHDAGFLHNYQVNLANIGNVYLHRGENLTAIEYYRRALELARQIKDPVSIKKWTRNMNLAYARIRWSVDQQNPRIA
jgi:tetratricopeptide (TPR) repeat protein